jgi:hypothetical protein
MKRKKQGPGNETKRKNLRKETKNLTNETKLNKK